MLRYNPSDLCFVHCRNKINDSRKLTIEDFRTPKSDLSIEEMALRLRQLLFDIVRSKATQIPKGCHLGVLSSGGIDSSTILAILVRLGYDPQAITVGFGEEHDEIESAEVVAQNLGIGHRVRVVDKILDSTTITNSLLDEPYRAACFYYDTLKFAHDCGVECLFDGLGVDEFFGGYDFRYEKVLQLATAGRSRVKSYLFGAHPNDYTEDDKMFGPLLREIEVDWNGMFPYFDNSLPLLEQVFIADYNAKCRQSFVPLARLATEVGIDICYPWLNNEFIDFSLRVPSELKYDPASGRSKILFRKAVEDLVPSEAIRKPKQGFGPSPKRVFDELRRPVRDLVMDGQLVSSGYLSRGYYKTAIEADSPSTVQINKCWDAFTLEKFLEEIS